MLAAILDFIATAPRTLVIIAASCAAIWALAMFAAGLRQVFGDWAVVAMIALLAGGSIYGINIGLATA